jgi:glycine/D-amino acid oxidase-like deaminating enzyme
MSVVVVGGGIMGASIALHLARRLDAVEAPVVLLERRALGAGSSGRSGAVLRQFYSDRELVAMARDSLRDYAGFEFSTGRPIGFTRCGVATIASRSNPAAAGLVERNAALMRSLGIDARLLGARELRELVPGIAARDDTVAVHEPDAGYVDPQRTVEALAAVARSSGATIRTGAEVTAIAIERGRALGVETRDGRIEAEHVVVAAGPWTRALLRRAGFDLPLRVIRPEQHFVEMPSARASASTYEPPLAPEADVDPRFSRLSEPAPAHPVLLDLENDFYTRCEPALGRTRVGAMSYGRDLELEDPDALDERVSEGFQRWARAALSRRMPEYGNRPDVGAQAAWYTLTPDAQAIIGPIAGLEGLTVVSGFSGHGFKLAPSVGRGVAQMVLGEPVTAFSPDFFSPARLPARGERAWSGRFGL